MLPKNLKYGSKVESAPAKSTRINIAPQNGTGPYQLGDTIILNIPTRANTVLVPSESYLKFTVQALTSTATNTTIRWDGAGAHHVIQRIRIWHGSNLLEDIDSYGLLAKMLFDLQVATPSSYGKYNILCGTRNDLVTTLAGTAPPQCNLTQGAGVNVNGVAGVLEACAAGAQYTTDLCNVLNSAINTCTAGINSSVSIVQVSGGEYLPNSANSSAILANNATTKPITYCLNLISLIGTLCNSHYFPTFACTSAPLRVEIQLIDQIVKGLCVSNASVPTLANGLISNVEYIASFIELGDSAMQMIESSLEGQPLQFVVGDYRNYQYSYALPATSSTQVTMPIPAKFSSLKSIFVCIRDKFATATYYPASTVSLGLIDYYFRVGPHIIPAKAPNTFQEMFSEVIKAIGSMSDIHYSPNIEKVSYLLSQSVANTPALDINGATNVGSGRFYIANDFENYQNANKDTIFAGYNSNTDDCFLVMDFNTNGGSTLMPGPTIGAVTNARFDAFALFDSVIVFENGTAYVRY